MMGDVSEIRAAILWSNGRRCLACDAGAEEVDHVKPRHAGGPGIPENLAPLCSYCNTVKSCMWPGHGYHPMPGHDDPQAALGILVKELEALEDIYGTSRLLEVFGEDGPLPAAWQLRQWHAAGLLGLRPADVAHVYKACA